MAWLIALALVWGVISWVAGLGDRLERHKTIQAVNAVKSQHDFLYNLYIVSWNYYQEFEQQSIAKWEQDGYSGNPFSTPVFQQVQIQLFGETAEQHAFYHGWIYLYQHNIPVYHLNSNLKQREQYGKKYVVAPNSVIDFQTLYEETKRDVYFGLQDLDHFFCYQYFEQPDVTVDPTLKPMIPPITDLRVGYYIWNGKKHRRPGFPYDYDQRVHLAQHQTVSDYDQMLSDDNQTFDMISDEGWRQRLDRKQSTPISVLDCRYKQCPCCHKEHVVYNIPITATTEIDGKQVQRLTTYVYCSNTNTTYPLEEAGT